jgi:squalene-hopene/tetraprenyl-beta-curcumene cyclase
MTDPDRLRRAYETAKAALLAERMPEGFWVGELSSSALATAVACIALKLVDGPKHAAVIHKGLTWLRQTQNADGGWGDTTKSFSNISTSMLLRAAFAICECDGHEVEKLETYLTEKCGSTPAERAEAIRDRYGKDRTFSVPILMTCALARLIPWYEVPRLPFELAVLPQSWYRFARMPVVSYALPALIAIGQCVHRHRPTWNPITGPIRWLAKWESLNVLRFIQPSSGGYLEASPLTAFVVMSLATSPTREQGAEKDVIELGVKFILDSMRSDGSWPIDTNLSIWVTTLSVNALAGADDLASLPDKPKLLDWLLAQQTKVRHPFTGAAPGGWGWSHCPGSVPDCDDTPGAVLALVKLNHLRLANKRHDAFEEVLPMLENASAWMRNLQNRDGGWPTFCRGWGRLPFDRSGSDLTAHVLRAMGNQFPTRDYQYYGLKYLRENQRPDGSWLPLWFGNQHAQDDENPVYGTARVLAAYRDLGLSSSAECQRGVTYLQSVQNPDGGWGGAKGCPSTVEETAVAMEVLIDLIPFTPNPSPPEGEGNKAIQNSLNWLLTAVETGQFREPSPIGFYFAKLWYFEKLYPLIFTVAALGRAVRRLV